MKIKLPKNVQFIIDQIYKSGYEAFIVGGCVRDSILGLNPNDYDVTTSAPPSEILNIFKNFKLIDNGIKHGTVGVIIDKEVYEITTYRLEGEYENNRRPKSVSFTSNLVEDLKRRDFTINAIAYNDKMGIIDKFDGMSDIKNKIVKTVGEPDKRFNEDGLRLIRAIRFSSKLNFKIESNTLHSIYKNANIIKNISRERITDEFSKILMGNNPQDIIILYKTGILKSIGVTSNISEEKYDEFEKDLEVLKLIPSSLIDRLSVLDFIIKYKAYSTDSIKDYLVYSSKVKTDSTLITKSMLDILNIKGNIEIKLKLNEVGIDILKKALTLSKIYFENSYLEDKILFNINEIINSVLEIDKNGECYKIRDLNINGKDIESLGYKGKEIGEILNKLLYKVIVNPYLNEKDILLSLI